MPRMISVLNGVNLNLLGRRDPEQYGSNTLQHLETQVYAWAKELGLNARCFQTNHEGAFVEQIHDAAEFAQGVIVNPARGRTTPTPSATRWSSWRSRSSRCTSRTSTRARRGARRR